MIESSINANDLADTRLACIHSISYLRKYVEGEYAPHYPVPALPMVVDIEPNYCAVFVWYGPEKTGDYLYYVAGNTTDYETLPRLP